MPCGLEEISSPLLSDRCRIKGSFSEGSDTTMLSSIVMNFFRAASVAAGRRTVSSLGVSSKENADDGESTGRLAVSNNCFDLGLDWSGRIKRDFDLDFGTAGSVLDERRWAVL